MEEKNDDDGDERVEAAGEKGRAVVGNDDGVVGDPNDAEDEQDHEGSQAPKRGAELEHVPRHHRPRSVHHCRLTQRIWGSTDRPISYLFQSNPIRLSINLLF